jgi:hypothetical protein
MTASAPVAAAVVVLAARCVLLQRRLADRDRYVRASVRLFGMGPTMTPQEPRRSSSLMPHHYMAPCWRQPGKQWWHVRCALLHPLRFARSRGPIRWRPR